MIKVGVVQILVVWLIMWLFSLLDKPSKPTKDIIYAVVMILLIIALFLINTVFVIA